MIASWCITCIVGPFYATLCLFHVCEIKVFKVSDMFQTCFFLQNSELKSTETLWTSRFLAFSLGDFWNLTFGSTIPVDFRFKSFDVWRCPLGSSFINFLNFDMFVLILALWYFRLENIARPPLLKQKHHLASKASRPWKPAITPFYNFDFWYCSESNLTLIFRHEIYSNQLRPSCCELDQTQIINNFCFNCHWGEFGLNDCSLASFGSICQESALSWWKIRISLSFAQEHQKNYIRESLDMTTCWNCTDFASNGRNKTDTLKSVNPKQGLTTLGCDRTWNDHPLSDCKWLLHQSFLPGWFLDILSQTSKKMRKHVLTRSGFKFWVGRAWGWPAPRATESNEVHGFSWSFRVSTFP